MNWMWIRLFQFFLFDFDGLLVNTEELQFLAYVRAMAKNGHELRWKYQKFCETAHLNSTALKEAICAEFPDLAPRWQSLYEDKKQAYVDLIKAGKIQLMPGVEALLKELATAGIRRCVVTNSPAEHIELICEQLPILRTIPYWVTREQYHKPKPDPEGYLRAIALYGKPNDRIIGFEDSIRGLQALLKTPAAAHLICPKDHPLLKEEVLGRARHFESLEEMSSNFSLQ